MASTKPEILDIYGNNAAVRCTKCERVFVVSKFLNKKKPRNCPGGCGTSVTFDGTMLHLSE